MKNITLFQGQNLLQVFRLTIMIDRAPPDTLTYVSFKATLFASPATILI